jgi:hypothetical protein
MDMRRDERVRKRGLARVDDKPGIMVDMSRGGIQITVPSLPKMKQVTIRLQLGERVINCLGEIIWVRRTLTPGSPHHMGIAIKSAPPEYLAIFG